MLGGVMVSSRTLEITPTEFIRWIKVSLSKAQHELTLEGLTFMLQSVQHNPPAVVGQTKNGSVTIEVIGHTVVATSTKDGYPTT